MKTPIALLLYLFLIGPQLLFAQSKMNIDSLLSVYQSQSRDTTKAKTANAIINYYMYRNNDLARRYAFELLDLSEQIDHLPGKCLALYQVGVCFNNQDQLDSASFYYQESLIIAQEINNGNYISQAYRGLAIIEFSQGNLLKADSINNLDLSNTIKYGDSIGTALAYDLKGTINQNKGYYSIALENVLAGLHLFEMLDDSIRIADAYNHLATLEYNLGNFQNALRYNKIALEIYESYEDYYYQAQALNDIGVAYMNLNQNAEAIEHYQKSMFISEKENIKSLQAASLTNMGTTHIQSKAYDQAIDYLNQSVLLSTAIDAKRRIAIAENKLAQVYLLKNNPSKAVEFALNAQAYAEENQNIPIKREAYKYLSNAYENLNNLTQALNSYKVFKALSDSIINKEKVDKIEELRIQFDLQKKEAENTLQKEEIKALSIQAENDRLSKTLFGSGMFSFIAISGLLFFGFKQRLKKNRIEREKQEEIYRQEIEHKKKELTSQTLHLVQKSTFIQELKTNLEKLKESPEAFKLEFRRLVMMLKKQSSEDGDWEVFKSYFSEVHNNFDDKLRSIANDISEQEIRLASFLRMNLTTKEIASLLNVLPDSVLKSKYRLKKKLQLSRDEDLKVYLKEI